MGTTNASGIAVPPTGELLFKPASDEKLNGWQFAISLGTILELKYNKSLEPTERKKVGALRKVTNRSEKHTAVAQFKR